MIPELFTKILGEYLGAIQQPFAKNSLAGVLRKELPAAIQSTAILSSDYLVVGSAGKGNWAKVPWVCVFDRAITTSAERGYYIVYLFDAAMTGVHLSLNLGWMQFRRAYSPAMKARDEIRSSAAECRRRILGGLQDFNYEEIDLHANNDLGRGYELGHICGKHYSRNAIPSDNEIANDLRNLIGVYRELKGLVGPDILNLRHLVEAAVEDVGGDALPFDQVTVAKRLATVKSPADIEAALKDIEEKSKGKEPQVIQRIANAIARNPTLARLIKEQANHTCEICGVVGFAKRTGGRYSEVHHLAELGKAGLDIPSNVICVCPTCHRVIHHGSEEELNSRRTMKGIR